VQRLLNLLPHPSTPGNSLPVYPTALACSFASLTSHTLATVYTQIQGILSSCISMSAVPGRPPVIFVSRAPAAGLLVGGAPQRFNYGTTAYRKIMFAKITYTFVTSAFASFSRAMTAADKSPMLAIALASPSTPTSLPTISFKRWDKEWCRILGGSRMI
jgi:hypothetical protein